MQLSDAYELMECDLLEANRALREGWTLLAVTAASSPVLASQLRTVYVVGRDKKSVNNTRQL